MKISIIGANSYIARNLCSVIAGTYPESTLCLYDIHEKHADNLDNYQKIDIGNADECKKMDFDTDIVFVFAGKTGTLDSIENFYEYIKINELSLLNVLHAHRSQNSRAKFIYPSTRLVYKGKEGTLKEDAEKEYKTIYATSKCSAENYFRIFNNLYGTQYTILRICVPYGTLVENCSSYGTAEYMLNAIKKQGVISLYGDGSVRRTITHIEDLCAIMLKASMNEACTGGIYNIGGEDYSLFEMATAIANRFNGTVKFVAYPEQALRIESGSTVFDASELDSILRYNYTHTFAEWINTI